ncbi:Oxygen-independent coproporphyrinogen-III oxidase-like protein YqeR [bacterium HR40]|nr:Oxygen-independent coproporphyrinogen-III oxidase-like protein YqeR [bacterium HR40]
MAVMRIASPATADRLPGTEPESPGDPGFALYVHWPFCLAKCPYCDFNSHVRQGVAQERFRRALLAELDHFAARTPGRRLRSIFFGGGTPSLMPPETVAAVIERAEMHWPFEGQIEITLEANPSSVETAKFRALASAGVNRVSLGVQSLDDLALRFLGRLHDAAEARRAVETALSCFSRVNLDLICGRPGQTVEAWRSELRQALAFGTGHLSCYQLTIEPGTRFFTLWRRGELALPCEERQAELWLATEEEAARAGLFRYEVSNHARPGEECRHNLVYWRYGEYVGIGPGAHGRLCWAGSRVATRTERLPERWLSRVERQGHGTVEEEQLSPRAQALEYLLLALRLAEGVDLHRLAALAGGHALSFLDVGAIERYAAAGLLELRGEKLRASPRGMLMLDRLLVDILA